MRILLVDVDSVMPNLALMKISAWHKQEGDEVGFSDTILKPDKVYISCVFERNKGRALGCAKFWELLGCDVEVGGYGVNDNQLPPEIEYIKPDYDLYGIDYSMGFTQRGCIRRCPWCVVWRKEGLFREHTPIGNFWDPRHKKIILLDNIFNASQLWKEKLEFILKNRLMVNFHQGLDIRLIDDEQAKWLSLVDFRTHTFKTRMLHFAFDDPSIEDDVRKGVACLKRHGIKPYELTFYMLCGFNTTFREDLHRFKVLRDLGVWPYVMVYNDRRDVPILRHFERYVNAHPPLYKVCDFVEYDHGDSQYWIKKETKP